MNINFESKKTEDTLTDKPNALKGEHLNEGIKPIVCDIYVRPESNNESDKESKFFKEFEKNAEFLDFRLNPEKFFSSKWNKNKDGTYLISPIDGKNKYSKDFLDCLSVCVVGKEIETGKNISFISHQNPEALFENRDIRERFEKDLKNRIREIVNRCGEGTIDVVILGGNKDVEYNEYINSADTDKMNQQELYDFMEKNESGPFEKYKKTIYLLDKIFLETLKLDPIVTCGPNSNIKINDLKSNNALDLYFNTYNRNIYIVRPKNEKVNDESFLASDVDNQIKKYAN